jgi:hypothetical protein
MLSSYVPSAANRGGEVIAVPIRDLSTRGVGVQQQAPAALLPEKGPCAHCTGGWLGLEAGLDVYGKCRLRTGVRIPDRPARSKSPYQLRYPSHNLPTFKTTFRYKKIFSGFETRLVGIDVSETITLLYYEECRNGDGKVVRNVLFLQY